MSFTHDVTKKRRQLFYDVVDFIAGHPLECTVVTYGDLAKVLEKNGIFTPETITPTNEVQWLGRLCRGGVLVRKLYHGVEYFSVNPTHPEVPKHTQKILLERCRELDTPPEAIMKQPELNEAEIAKKADKTLTDKKPKNVEVTTESITAEPVASLEVKKGEPVIININLNIKITP